MFQYILNGKLLRTTAVTNRFVRQTDGEKFEESCIGVCLCLSLTRSEVALRDLGTCPEVVTAFISSEFSPDRNSRQYGGDARRLTTVIEVEELEELEVGDLQGSSLSTEEVT